MIINASHIIFDKIESWPKEMLDLIKDNEISLKGFLEEEHRIEKLARKDMSVRYNIPQNIYREKWNIIINEIENILRQHSIIGIHCTKLLDWEINDIELNGLKPLNRKFANQRIEKAFNKRLISKELRDELVDKEEFDADNRKGYIFVFHCLQTLNSESGLNRLLGLWGGESLYAYVKDNQELKHIGTPCIVFASIKINELDIYPGLSKRMTAFYYNNNLFPHDTDSIIKTDLNVLRIIRRDEKVFEDLTHIQRWDDERY